MKTIPRPPLKRKILAVFVMSYFVTACGSSSNSVTNNVANTPQELAMALIAAYAQDGTNTVPSLQDYQDAGVEGVNSDNLGNLNTLVESLELEDVDTVSELDALTAQLGINIVPTVDAGDDISATVDQELVITGTAEDSDGSISQYEWKNSDDVVIATTASFNYTPSAEGTEDLTLTVTDNDGAIASDTVTVTISAANQAPTADAGESTIVEVNQSVTIEGSGTDADGTISAYEWKDAEGNVIGSDATLNYTPTSTGSQILTLMVTDDNEETATDTVELVVTAPTPVNQAPSASDITITTDEDTNKAISLLGSDAEEATLSYLLDSAPTHGIVNFVADIATYTPDTNFNGSDSFTYKVNDGSLDSAVATVNITVNPVNDAPIAYSSALPAVISEGTSAQLNSLGSSDPDGDSLSYSWTPADRLDDPNSSTPTYSAPLVNQETTITFTLTVSDYNNPSLVSFSTVDLTILNDAPPAEQPSYTAKINDTGQNTCSDFPFNGGALTSNGSNNVSCTTATDTVNTNGNPIPPGQDAQYTTPFSFIKLDANGVALADQSGTQFSCVKDNNTGLIWEIKTDSGLHNKKDRFYWYDGVKGTENVIPHPEGGHGGINTVVAIHEIKTNSDLQKKNNDKNAKAGGFQLPPPICYGYTNGSTDNKTFCNTKAYTDRVNLEGFCGATDWQVPTMNEAISIVDLAYLRNIDPNYFPDDNHPFTNKYWTSSLTPSSPVISSASAMRVEYDNGISIRSFLGVFQHNLRLVRRATPTTGQ